MSQNEQGFLPELPRPLIEAAVAEALREDVGRAGDITSMATIPPDQQAEALIVARQSGRLCGIALAEAAFRLCDPKLVFTPERRDGEKLAAKDVVARISGPARGLLSGERVALNYLCHLSGIASITAAFAEKIGKNKARICCTRKTTPGLRAFEKYAVRCGGGANHRFGLDDAMLIKDNHIAIAGGVALAISRARAFAGHMVKIEVEVDTLAQLEEALAAKPDAILLDNMALETLRRAVAMVAGKVPLEASGNVTLATIAAIAETGVDFISSGWITHSAPILDLGLDIIG